MSTDCTITRLARCRVRDLASCFYACRLPIEEEAESSGSGVPISPEGTLDKKMCNDNGKSVESSSLKNKRIEDNSSWPSFVEEDYIVFCFREDGAIEMINECKSSSSESFHQNTLKPINRKLRYGSNRDSRNGSIVDSEEKDNQTNDKEIDILDAKVDEIKEMNNSGVEETGAHTFESCDSNLSDTTSTSSFAFPVLGMEWMGSPVKMPESEKHKNRNVHLYCCRF